jgi:hypothetical protein
VTPRAIAPGLWVVDGRPLHIFGLSLPVRMTVVRLADGSLLLHSPVQHSDALAASLAALGPVRHLLAPNIAHWTMLRDWQSACPDARTYAAPLLRRRRPVRRSGLRIDAEISDALPPSWQPDLVHVLVPGAAGFRELALLHVATRSAILTDLVQNMDPTRMPRAMRLVGGLLGMTGQDGRPPIYLRLAVRLGGEAARAAVAEILAWRPERVIFSHGDWFEADGAARLRRALTWMDAKP